MGGMGMGGMGMGGMGMGGMGMMNPMMMVCALMSYCYLFIDLPTISALAHTFALSFISKQSMRKVPR